MESPPNSPRLGNLSIESLRSPAPEPRTPFLKMESPRSGPSGWDQKPDKYLARTLRLPPALGEAFRIMEKNLYIPPATLQHPEYLFPPFLRFHLSSLPLLSPPSILVLYLLTGNRFQHTLDALRANPKNPAPPPPHATLPRILHHPDSQSAFERLYRQILPNLANHLVFILKIMLAAAPTVKNYAGTINLNLEGYLPSCPLSLLFLSPPSLPHFPPRSSFSPLS